MQAVAVSSSRLRFLISASALGAYLFSLCCLLAQVFPKILLLQLIVSFMPHGLIAGALASAGLAVLRPRVALVGALFVMISGAPFILFSKYQAPDNQVCEPGECLTVITANLYASHEAMENLSAIAAQEDADLIAINEAVSRMTDYAYSQVFPDHPYVVHAAWENMPRGMGSPITLLARVPIANQDRVLRSDTARRAYIVADLGGDWQDTRVLAAHAMAPFSTGGLVARDTLLEVAGNVAQKSGTFIMLGDFNLTPWTRQFRALPGKRAGDPRLSVTWPTPLRAFGIPIDHIMFDGDLELVSMRVLAVPGSDHLAVLARFRRP